MDNKKQVLQGIDNFKEIIEQNGYYIDKTLLIKDLIDRPDKIVLITRPRRFGKTLNMSMLKYFFEIPECRKHELEEEDISYLFEGLKIFEEEKYRQIQGTHPVIFMTFKSAKQDDWETTYENIKYVISNEYKRHRYVLDSDVLNVVEKQTYEKVMHLKADKVEYTNVIEHLCEYLKRYFKKDCVVILDEYDTPIQAGYLNGYFNEVIEFMKSMLVKGLKGNNALKQGVVTGIMKVAQESIFSDFNNPMVSTLLSERFSDKFGFTEDEVEEMAMYFGIEEKLEEIKDWYNGYLFGLNTVIYNPWSIIKYMSSPIEGFKPYWINTSDNRIIKKVMQLEKKEGKEVVEKLIKGEEVRKPIQENVVYQNIETNTDVAWSFLLHSGYLKASGKKKDFYGEKDEYNLQIPNKEVRMVYRDMIFEFFKEDEKISNEINNFLQSLSDGNIEEFEMIMNELYFKQMSFYDVPKDNINNQDFSQQKIRHENFYHGFMLGLLIYATEKFEVFSNREYGLGRPDVVLIPRNKEKTAYIFEFKWDSTKGKKTLELLTEEAIKQIKEKRYIEGVKKEHNIEKIIAFGFGFKGKEIKLENMEWEK